MAASAKTRIRMGEGPVLGCENLGPESDMATIREELIAAGDPYPAGEAGDLAVGHYKHNGAAWVLEMVASRKQAEARFREILGRDDVLRVVLESGHNQGRPSVVAWIARCNGGRDWAIIEETEGMRQFEPRE